MTSLTQITIKLSFWYHNPISLTFLLHTFTANELKS